MCSEKCFLTWIQHSYRYIIFGNILDKTQNNNLSKIALTSTIKENTKQKMRHEKFWWLKEPEDFRCLYVRITNKNKFALCYNRYRIPQQFNVKNTNTVNNIQLKLETSKSQGLAKITRSIRKSTHPKGVFSMLLKYNMPLEKQYVYAVVLHHTKLSLYLYCRNSSIGLKK